MVSVAQTATGAIDTYIGNIIDDMPSKNGDDYISPSTSQLNSWNTMINNILSNDIASARTVASNLNYEVVEFTDTSVSPNQVFYVVKEKSGQTYYWGTYVFSKTPVRNNLIIQAPHAKYDSNTGKQAAYCFKNTVARALFINGTHRCNSSSYSSCSGTTGVCGTSGENYRISDLAHTTTAVFQKTTENLFTNISNSVFIQLHGFGKRSSDPYVIMSNGTRVTPSTDYAVAIKNALLQEDSSLTFKIAHIDTSWTRLTGFTNTQGRYINTSSNPCTTNATNTAGRFVHIEQERNKLRSSASKWIKMSNALKAVFQSTLNTNDIEYFKSVKVYPNPAKTTIYIKGVAIDKAILYNTLGKEVLRKENASTSKSMSLSIAGLAKGFYYMKLMNKTKIKVVKILIE